ncbi:c-type cytochrome [Deinococcus ruber]|nr:cytochrome c [Deinococcus ruber]
MRATVAGSATLLIFLLLLAGAYRTGTGLSGIHPQSGTATAATLPAPADGSSLFAANCAGCHGPKAQGGVGPKLAGLVKPWTQMQFEHAVLDGKAPEGRTLAPMMPHFRSAGFDGSPPTDAQLRALAQYLQSL